MKFLIIFINLLFLINLKAQTNVAQIDATLASIGNEATVTFTPNSTFQATGEASSLKVWIKVPASTTASAVVSITSNPFNLLFIASGVNGSDRIYQYQATFGTPFQYSSWSANTPVEIASFTITGFTGPSLEVSLATFGFSGSSWNGTSINRIISGNYNNLVTWPITSTTVLPITIKTFSATKDGERTARLDWTSSSEINSDYIGIERSTDGEDWTTVGQVKAAGNSNRDIDYVYYDRSLPMVRSIDNIFYYRLKLTDLDGQYKYSETRGVNLGRLEGLVSIYPNPATDIINVDLTDMDLHEGIIHLSVYDNAGKAIISKEVNGAGIEPIQASNMAAGTYNVVVKQGDTTHRKQIIVVN